MFRTSRSAATIARAVSCRSKQAPTINFTKPPSSSRNEAPWTSHVAGPDETEAQLLERLVRRDERAFNELVRTHQGRVYGLVLRMMGDRAEAEDLAQEVFVQVFKAIGSFRGESKLSTWIYRIAINLCKNRVKYLKVRHTDEQDTIEDVAERAPLTDARPANVSQ